MNVGNCKDSQQRGGKFNHNNRAYSVQLLLSDTQAHSLEQTTPSLDLRSCSITLTISIAYLLHYVLGYLKDSNAAAHSADTGIS